GIYTNLADGTLSHSWTHINALGRELQFYRDSDGRIATGRLATNGTYTNLADGTLSRGWDLITGVV
ncbi:hypothetical protein, partial [Streptomyces sp. NPDC101206]|uniref:hypothetical protein n=1 Tax=Streptomyces sp. NPDC101206 TaxID=3366128 RepID=UPI0037F9C52B